MASLPSLQAGQLFAERYRVIRLIKAGGMGAVYEVRHTGNDKRWALKLMHPELARDADARERFQREAKIDGLIESAHVVSVIDAGIDAPTETPYLVMEFLVGEELGDRLQRVSNCTADEVVTYLRQVARALDKAHAKKIIHRDLKPENLFLCQNDEEGDKVKVLDFGIAKLLESAVQSSTGAGGTPLYMAPEQTRRGRDIGPWTDIWALGLIAYTLLVGDAYWQAETIGELYGELLSNDPREAPSARALGAGVALPKAFDEWFFRCVDNDTRKRFARAGDAITELAAALGVGRESRAIPETLPMTSGSGTVPMAPLAAVALEAASWPTKTGHVGGKTTGSPLSTEPVEIPGLSSSWRRLLYPALGLGVVGLVGGGLGLANSLGWLQLGSDQRAESTPPAPSVATVLPAGASATTGKPQNELRAWVDSKNAFLPVGKIAMQRTEVTRAEYARFVDSLPAAQRQKARPLRGWPAERLEPGTERRPVTWVTFRQARQFCDAVEARLPTSGEWTTAAGSQGGLYPWGDVWPPPDGVAYGKRASTPPVDVGSSPGDKTSAGHFDLFGNVSEWTSTITNGAAKIRGAQIVESPDEAKGSFVGGLQKAADGRADSTPEELADPLTGFRCIRESLTL